MTSENQPNLVRHRMTILHTKGQSPRPDSMLVEGSAYEAIPPRVAQTVKAFS